MKQESPTDTEFMCHLFIACCTMPHCISFYLLQVQPNSEFMPNHRKSNTWPSFLGPVVQSIASLTSSLSGPLVKRLPLYNQIHWYFWLKKWEKLLQLHCKSFSHFFNKKYWHIWGINVWNFNETLTNDVGSFEQPGPGNYRKNKHFKSGES